MCVSRGDMCLSAVSYQPLAHSVCDDPCKQKSSRPSTCGSNKLESISQRGEIVFPFTNRFRKKRTRAKETAGKRKDQIYS